MKALVLIAALLAASPALAEGASTPRPQPCQRGASHIVMGGVDLDEMRCELALGNNQVGLLSSTIIAQDARMRLMADDLEQAKAAVEVQRKRADAAEEKLPRAEVPADMSKVDTSNSVAPKAP